MVLKRSVNSRLFKMVLKLSVSSRLFKMVLKLSVNSRLFKKKQKEFKNLDLAGCGHTPVISNQKLEAIFDSILSSRAASEIMSQHTNKQTQKPPKLLI